MLAKLATLARKGVARALVRRKLCTATDASFRDFPRTLGLRAKLANSIETHRLCNDPTDVLHRFYKVRISDVGVAGGGPISSVPKYFAH